MRRRDFLPALAVPVVAPLMDDAFSEVPPSFKDDLRLRGVVGSRPPIPPGHYRVVKKIDFLNKRVVLGPLIPDTGPFGPQVPVSGSQGVVYDLDIPEGYR